MCGAILHFVSYKIAHVLPVRHYKVSLTLIDCSAIHKNQQDIQVQAFATAVRGVNAEAVLRVA